VFLRYDEGPEIRRFGNANIAAGMLLLAACSVGSHLMKRLVRFAKKLQVETSVRLREPL
jgi:hypothetical protein